MNNGNDLLNIIVQHGMRDPDVRRIVVDYLRSTLQAKESWREVWRQISDDERWLAIEPPEWFKDQGAKPEVIAVRLRLAAHYDERAQVGKIVAYMVRRSHHPNGWEVADEGALYGQEPNPKVAIENHVLMANSYTDVITAAQQHWTFAYSEFVARTTEHAPGGVEA